MKRMLLSFTILTILLIYNICSENYIMTCCDETIETLEACAEDIKKEAYTEAKITADKLLESWEKNNTLLSTIIGDSDTSTAYGNIVTISRSLDDSMYDECLSTIRECQGNMREIKEQNRTSFGNVL